jgi:acetylornithine deacetylase
MKMSDSADHSRETILGWVEEHRADIIGLTQSLIRFPSENKPPHGNEKDCQMFVSDFLQDIGCRVDVFQPDEAESLTDHPEYWPGRDYTDRPNVVGVLASRSGEEAGKPNGRKSLLFSGHVDVVPAIGEGQFGWWDGTIEEGKLYGRGSNDMKGGIAAYLMAARCVRELGLELKGDLILETVVDEEFGGANGTLACRLRGYNADVAINPEPNNMLVSTSHRGGQQFRLYVAAEGVGMGFGETELRDPVIALGHLLAALDGYNAKRNARPKPKGFENDVFPLMPFVLRAGEILPWGTGEAIPETAWVEFWIEIPPGITKDELQSELRAVVEKATETTPALQRVETRWEERTRFLAGSTMPDDHPVLKALSANLEFVTGQPASHGAAPFACDGFIFNLHSPTPVAILGPRGANAHAPDEWVEVEDLITLTKTFALTIAGWLT